LWAVLSDFEEGVQGWWGVIEGAAAVVGEDYAAYLRRVEGGEMGVFVYMDGEGGLVERFRWWRI